MPTVCYDTRRRQAKDVVRSLQRLGLALKTEVLVMQNGDVYVTCLTADPAALAILGAGRSATMTAGVRAQTVELYRGAAIVRFQGASGGGMVPASAAHPNGPRANRRPPTAETRRR